MSGHKWTEIDFQSVKRLQRRGLPGTQISRALGLGYGSVCIAMNSADYKEFQSMKGEENRKNAAYLKQYRNKVYESAEKNEQQGNTNTAFQYNMNRVHEQIKAQNEQLALLVAYMRDCAKSLNEIKESWK